MKYFLTFSVEKKEKFEKLSHIQTRELVFGNYGVLHLLLNFDFKSDLFPLDFSREILNLKCIVYKNELDKKRLWVWCWAFICHWNAHGWKLASHGFIKSHITGLFISLAWTESRAVSFFPWHTFRCILATSVFIKSHVTGLFLRQAWTTYWTFVSILTRGSFGWETNRCVLTSHVIITLGALHLIIMASTEARAIISIDIPS